MVAEATVLRKAWAVSSDHLIVVPELGGSSLFDVSRLLTNILCVCVLNSPWFVYMIALVKRPHVPIAPGVFSAC